MGQDAGFHRRVLLGVRAYAGPAKRWFFFNAAPTPAVLRPLEEWEPHGIIAHLNDAKVARAILKLGKPVVDTACVLRDLGVPAVDVDHLAVGRMAADYFVARGYRNFGYYGSEVAYLGQLRQASYRQALEERGFPVSSCGVEYLPRLPERTSWKGVNTRVRQWLKALAKPVAVLADHDVSAHDLADMCQIVGLRVPDEVAILGVDDDELECQLAFLPLSSVAVPAERVGFQAATLLDRMLAGKRVAAETIFLPPTRVVTRHSTSRFAVEEPMVTAALHYIRNHLADPLKVSTIAAALVVRRRELEQKFRKCLGRSVLAEIHRARVERVKELLTETGLSMADVAAQAGFSTAQRMATVFRKLTGLTPGSYRQQNRVRPQP